MKREMVLGSVHPFSGCWDGHVGCIGRHSPEIFRPGQML